ncbi:MAG: ABC transporter ATP-binding protein [Chloroherpetonaceae bacterium]|nr:ABC transporter ATP-binding protein [Chthonomonadaceae bacterium]MDW8209112.1 ABC transporter ATP-binding protein [Chloroherpetonaceae bacterium]
MSVMVRVDHLRKEYRGLVAVRDLCLEVEAGDILGLIGPNGAGKTTTIKVLATLLAPTSGTVWIDGIDVVAYPEEVRAIIGYMPDFFGVYDDIKVWEYLDFFAAAYRIPRDRRARIIDDVLALTDLSAKRDAYVETLSRGMKQRLCLAKTLVHDPKVLLLDEPASGLDPRARIEIRELLKELRAMGKTIIVSSHILPEMEEFCNKIAIMERGELVIAGEVEAIARRLRGQSTFEIGVVDALAQAEAVLRGLTDLVGAVDVVEDDGGDGGSDAPALEGSRGGVLHVAYTGEAGEEYRVLHALVLAGVKVRLFRPLPASLEEVFLQVTRGQVA